MHSRQIDDDVIQACKKHLRGVCGDALDNYDGPRHKILVEDCVKVLKDFLAEGKQVSRNLMTFDSKLRGSIF